MRAGLTRALIQGALVLWMLGAAARAALGDDRPVRAEPPATSPSPSAPVTTTRTFGLALCLHLAEENHPNIWAAQARLRGMRAQLDEAHSAPFTQFTLTAGLGLAPTLRGNDLYSPDTDIFLRSSFGLG